ncbi:MAG TPA: hypothetical protein VFP98_09590 [Candidatus Polarisedimenticolia bacterium]|nr:hypothetical protein [Candidatus Polarisedimenticolia bacterium]
MRTRVLHGGSRKLLAPYAALAAAALLGAAGCPRAGKNPVESPPSVEIQQTPPHEPPLEPPEAIQQPQPPSEAELAVKAARDAAARREYESALLYYARAAGSEIDPVKLGDIHYDRALIYADPGSGMRNLELARSEFQQVLDLSPSHPRAREILLMVATMDESRLQGEELKARITALEARIAELQSALEKKDKELKNLEKVLLQKQP